MKKLFLILFLFVARPSFSQDLAFGRKMVDTLTSPTFWGRGYTNDGMGKAARFLGSQFKSYGLLPISGTSYFQEFSYPVNTFPGRMKVVLNGKELTPGKEFIVSANSRGVRASGTLQATDSTHFVNNENNIIIALKEKLTWSVAARSVDHTTIELDSKILREPPRTIQVDIESKEVSNFGTANVCGWVKGRLNPDSVIVISAHYDHLGGMGSDTYFAGANDNASGTSLLLGLARYYAAHPPPYTIAFICFAGEEAGLRGSKYFVQHPLFPLRKISFLLNLDLEGTGDEGITVVNATEFSRQFAALNAVNKKGGFVASINARGKAANSDHYWFSEEGVPAFFMYTRGGIKAYHDVFDRAETLPLNEYEDLFHLIVQFNQGLMK